jgi:hypothetical protein
VALVARISSSGEKELGCRPANVIESFIRFLSNDVKVCIGLSCIHQRWALALFSRFRAREREAKKRARKREEKRARKKAKAPSAKEKKREFALFPQPTVEIRFQSPKLLGRGEKPGSSVRC